MDTQFRGAEEARPMGDAECTTGEAYETFIRQRGLIDSPYAVTRKRIFLG
jgi:hypothetical protein